VMLVGKGGMSRGQKSGKDPIMGRDPLEKNAACRPGNGRGAGTQAKFHKKKPPRERNKGKIPMEKKKERGEIPQTEGNERKIAVRYESQWGDPPGKQGVTS